jgi:hypothetical protein
VRESEAKEALNLAKEWRAREWVEEVFLRDAKVRILGSLSASY